MIEFKLYQTWSKNFKTPSIRSFYCRNYNSINKLISGVDRIYFFSSTKDINDIYSRFTNIVNESIKRYTPFYRVNKKPHLPSYLKNLQHFKTLLYKQTKADPFVFFIIFLLDFFSIQSRWNCSILNKDFIFHVLLSSV